MIFMSVNRRAARLGTAFFSALLLLADTVTAGSTSDQPLTETSNASSQPATKPDEPTSTDSHAKTTDDDLRIREFFNASTPGTTKKSKLLFSATPRSTDIREGEFIRVSTQLRYGLADRWEIFGGMTPFFPSPINDGAEHRWGLGEAKLGVRYDWGHWGTFFDHVTVGLESRTPLGEPPPALIDYFSHVAAFINTSRPLSFKHTYWYTTMTYDRAVHAPFREAAPYWATRTHVLIVTNSIRYMPGEFGAAASHSYRIFFSDGVGTHFGNEFRAGPIWDIPLWRTQSWGLPGKWQFEVAARVSFEEGVKTNKGISARIRWHGNIHEVFSKKSYQRKPRP
jgi:hypothetical protein